MPTTTVNGTRLHHEQHGAGESLLCVTGLGADVLSWVLQIPALAERYRTIVFDNRDVGRSQYVEEPYEIEDLAADALALADALGLADFHLLGVSMGGAIAQRMALRAPARVRTLTLGVSFGGGGAWAREKARQWGAELARKTRPERIDEILLLTMSEALYENTRLVSMARERLLANAHPQPVAAFVRQLEASCRHEARAELGSLRMPVHVIGAEHDLLIPVWKSRELAALIPGARLTVIEGAPHAVHMERAAEFNAAVLEFLSLHA